MSLKLPEKFKIDDRIEAGQRKIVEEINASLMRLNELRAVQINVSGHFARSKVAWKLATYQHALLHRMIALMDGVALAWNCQSTLSAMLSARAFMETFAVFSALESCVGDMLQREDIAGLDTLAQQGTFASRDREWLRDFPDSKSVNVLTYIDKFDRVVKGFRGHYDRLSERCHPNSLGHHFMFAKLDREEGCVRYSDENEPARNTHMIISAVAPIAFLERIMTSLDENIRGVAELQHRIFPAKT